MKDERKKSRSKVEKKKNISHEIHTLNNRFLLVFLVSTILTAIIVLYLVLLEKKSIQFVNGYQPVVLEIENFSNLYVELPNKRGIDLWLISKYNINKTEILSYLS